MPFTLTLETFTEMLGEQGKAEMILRRIFDLIKITQREDNQRLLFIDGISYAECLSFLEELPHCHIGRPSLQNGHELCTF
jgi:hypothetical protein